MGCCLFIIVDYRIEDELDQTDPHAIFTITNYNLILLWQSTIHAARFGRELQIFDRGNASKKYVMGQLARESEMAAGGRTPKPR